MASSPRGVLTADPHGPAIGPAPAGGVLLVSLLGSNATFAAPMPGFALVGIGSGLTVPLTDAIMRVMPAERAGIGSALFNSAREVSGLLGIAVIGAALAAGRVWRRGAPRWTGDRVCSGAARHHYPNSRGWEARPGILGIS